VWLPEWFTYSSTSQKCLLGISVSRPQEWDWHRKWLPEWVTYSSTSHIIFFCISLSLHQKWYLTSEMTLKTKWCPDIIWGFKNFDPSWNERVTNKTLASTGMGHCFCIDRSSQGVIYSSNSQQCFFRFPVSDRGFDIGNNFWKRSLTRVLAKTNVDILLLALRQGFRCWIQPAQVYRSGSTRSVFIVWLSDNTFFYIVAWLEQLSDVLISRT